MFCHLQWVASIDLNANEEASANVTVKMTESFTEQASQVGATTVFFLTRNDYWLMLIFMNVV